MPRFERRRKWIFTWNNYTAGDCEILAQAFENLKSQWVFQEETGENGTPHLQGAVIFPNQRRLSQLKKINVAIHWEKMRGTTKQAVAYCTKVATRTGEIFTNMNLPKQVESPLVNKELFPWQRDCLEEMNGEPDDRTIRWIWDNIGSTGKTVFAKHLVITKPKKVLYVHGAANNVLYAVAQAVAKGEFPEIVIFALPRTQEGFVSYAALEQVKDGIFFSGKYESTQCVFPIPHVLVLANFPPDKSKLSQDRWVVSELKEEESRMETSDDDVSMDEEA